MQILAIMAGIEAAIAAAPKAIEVAQKGKELITSLFNAGVIPASTQDVLHARVDLVQEAFLAGNIPPELTVEADPITPASATTEAPQSPS